MPTRKDLVDEAASWVGTPAIRNQSAKGRGVDCKGLIYGIARETGMPEAMVEAAGWNHYRSADPALLLEGLSACLKPTENPKIGDVACIFIGKPPQPRHLAMLVENNRIVHCYGRSHDRVVKVPLGNSRPIHSWWTWPSLGDD